MEAKNEIKTQLETGLIYLGKAVDLFNKVSEAVLKEEKGNKITTGTEADDFLAKTEFIQILGISNSTFCKWEREKKIKVTRLGRGIAYVHKNELERLLKNAA